VKLLRYGKAGNEKPGILDADGQIRDLSNHVSDVNPNALSTEELARLSEIDVFSLPVVDGKPRLGPCLADVGKIVCIGLNYHDHAKEVGKSAPSEPMIFMKATTSICGPNDPVEVPRTSQTTDWEVELGIVIGKRAKYVEENNALQHVAGYLCINDVSERSFQADRQGQWTKGKSHDTHGPIGPYLVTADEVRDPHALRLWTEVDGVMRQDSSTDQMVFSVGSIVSYLSQFMTLEGGDIIATGTPAGVGKGIKPEPVYLKPGSILRCGIEGLGEQEHTMVAA